MKSVLKKFPKILNLLLIVNQLVRRSADRVLGRKMVGKYLDAETVVGRASPIDDLAVALFARTLIEGGHKSVIEIGTYTGERILALKRLFPDIDAVGLDILTNFKTPQEKDGVLFQFFSDEAFAQEFETPIVLSRGTLSYFTPEELERFFDTLTAHRLAIAFFEPGPFFHIEKSTVRYKKKNRTAYYHPYDNMLEERGYTLRVDKKKTYNWVRSMYGLECLRFQYATL